MNTVLYPLKFKPILKSKIWGGHKLNTIFNKGIKDEKIGESWELSGIQGDTSIVLNGFLKDNTLEEIIEIYMGDIVGEPVFNKFNKEFPLLFKFIDANQDLSIQVHPDDKLSKEKHNAYGKTEMWYIVDAEPESQLISGFITPSNKEEYLEALNSNKITSLLKSHNVDKEDAFFIPAGNIHAIGSGILLAEIQQTSDVTYRIYDYNRKGDDGNPRELHTDLALDAIDFKNSNERINYNKNKQDETVNITACEYFVTNYLNLKDTFERDVYLLNSFVVYMCTDGSATIKCENGIFETINKGETVLIPASIQNIELIPNNQCKLLEVYIKL